MCLWETNKVERITYAFGQSITIEMMTLHLWETNKETKHNREHDLCTQQKSRLMPLDTQ